MKRITIVGAVLAFLALSGFTCGPDKSREDAHDVTADCRSATDDGCIDKTPPKSIGFNNKFPTFQTKCDGFGHRIFTTTKEHGDKVIIIPDPSCPGYVEGKEPQVVFASGR